jgi:hypothetical protein
MGHRAAVGIGSVLILGLAPSTGCAGEPSLPSFDPSGTRAGTDAPDVQPRAVGRRREGVVRRRP